ncbi:SRPBCC domain-containing protein [Shimia sp.]|uniref:SRPBCC family protein n=1 Tax=Shimia sp. TaxID=1954381 RepID=UPI0032973EAB
MDIKKSYTLPFPVDQVFAAWISSDTVIAPASRMLVEPAPGGRYQLFMEGPDGGASTLGVFHKVEHNARLIYTWEWNGDGAVSLIDVTFRANEGGTVITLAHRGFTSADSANMHDSGWDAYISGLVAFLGKR